MNRGGAGALVALLWSFLLLIVAIWHPYVTTVGAETAAGVASLLTAIAFLIVTVVIPA